MRKITLDVTSDRFEFCLARFNYLVSTFPFFNDLYKLHWPDVARGSVVLVHALAAQQAMDCRRASGVCERPHAESGDVIHLSTRRTGAICRDEGFGSTASTELDFWQ